MFCMSRRRRGGWNVRRATFGRNTIRVRTDEENLLFGPNEALHGVRRNLLLAAPWRAVQFEHRPALEAAAQEFVERWTGCGVTLGRRHHRCC